MRSELILTRTKSNKKAEARKQIELKIENYNGKVIPWDEFESWTYEATEGMSFAEYMNIVKRIMDKFGFGLNEDIVIG